jgi:hypothetical protein
MVPVRAISSGGATASLGGGSLCVAIREPFAGTIRDAAPIEAWSWPQRPGTCVRRGTVEGAWWQLGADEVVAA